MRYFKVIVRWEQRGLRRKPIWEYIEAPTRQEARALAVSLGYTDKLVEISSSKVPAYGVLRGDEPEPLSQPPPALPRSNLLQKPVRSIGCGVMLGILGAFAVVVICQIVLRLMFGGTLTFSI